MVMSLLEFDEEGKLLEETRIPIVDGGTEGFKGNARVIMPTETPCIECTLDLYPPQVITTFAHVRSCSFVILVLNYRFQVNFPLCTIANTPRLPEHCIEYVRILQWPKENPFEPETAIDGDDPSHINWIYEKSLERANQFGITGVTYRLTQGVVKRIIPAVASTNAVIAAACATEVFKLATSCCTLMDNYMVFSDTEGIYTYTYKAEKKENCIACSRSTTTLDFPADITLQQVIDYLKENAEFQMRNPGVTTNIDGKNKTLFTHVIDVTKGNLGKKMIGKFLI